MNSNKRGFTLIELLVVVAMIGMIVAALGTSFAKAQERARVEKARSEVKLASQAILSYENYDRNHELPAMKDREADSGSLSFLIGKAKAQSEGNIPATLLAAFQSGGKWRDPWGTPYRISITAGGASVRIESAAGTMQTGFYFPNFYRLSEEERR